MKKLILLLLTVSLFSSGLMIAGDTDWLKYSLQIRHRFEMDGKDFNSDTSLNNYNLMRTRLGLTFTPMENVMGFFQVQDARLWGEESSTLNDGSADNFDLHQAYFKINKLFGANLALKLGRMELDYGPQRLIGSVGWHNIGRSFDGLVLSLYGEKYTIDLFSLKEVENLEFGDDGDKNLFGLYGDFNVFGNETLQAFVIWQKMNPTDDLSRFTVGLLAKGQNGGFRHELELAFQSGKIFGQDVSAFMGAANLGYNFGGTVKPDITFGLDYLSGDDDSSDNKYKVFDTLYATNHKYYGFMDYFINIPTHTYGAGLMDIHAAFSISPTAKTNISLKYHNFQAAKDVDLLTSISKNFGSEFDLTCKYQYNKALTFIAGASVFTPGDVFKHFKSDDSSSWFYLMTVFTIK